MESSGRRSRDAASTYTVTAPSCVMKAAGPLSPHDHLLEGIWGFLSRWEGLQMAVENEWGGRDSLDKSLQLAADVLSWFSQSKGASLRVEDLESLLYERMLLSFNTDIEDGSIEEVAEQLMIMHDEYLQLQGNHASVEPSKNPSFVTRNKCDDEGDSE